MSSELWLVTGGAGFIGSSIAETLLKQGQKVRILDNFSAGDDSKIKPFLKDIELIRGDIRNMDDVKKAVKGVSYVSHQAAFRSVPKSVIHPIESNVNNIDGTLNMLMASREAGVKRLVYASSSSAYGDSDKFPQSEDMATNPQSPYAVSKLTGEMYCNVWTACYGFETVSLRYFNVFGPKQDPESEYSVVIPKFMELAKKGAVLPVEWDGEQSRDFTYIDNVVEANIKAALAPKEAAGRAYNVGCGQSYSLLDLIRIIEKLLGRKLEIVFKPKRVGDVRKTYADITLAQKYLGYNPAMNFEQAVAKTWEYFNK